MTDTFTIPTDIAEQCRRAGEALDAHKVRLDRLFEIWADEDPDPENGDFWHIQIAHPKADQLRRDLAVIADFLGWLSHFTAPEDGGNHE